MFWLRLNSLAKKLLASLAILLGSAYALSCSVGGAPVRVVKGQAFPVDRVALVTEGMSASQVVELLGEPLTVTSEGDLSIWSYYARERKDDVIRVFGVLPIRRALSIWETEVDVYLLEETVQKADHSERRIK